jgi:hypothetical protein
MKRLIAIAFAAFTSLVFGATTTPISLLNPSGSSAGQAVVSNGPSSAPSWQTISLSTLTGIVPVTNGGTGSATAAGARSNLGLGTIATQSSSSVSLTGGAITGVSIANGTLSGATITNSPISGNAGSFTTLSATGLITPASAIGIKGTATNDSAASGSLGEYLTNTTASTSMTSVTPVACTSISLTAGDWDVSGTVSYRPAATTTISGLSAGITTAVVNSTANNGLFTTTALTYQTGQVQQISTPTVRQSLAATTTIYLIGYASFGTSTMACDGIIRARRVR